MKYPRRFRLLPFPPTLPPALAAVGAKPLPDVSALAKNGLTLSFTEERLAFLADGLSLSIPFKDSFSQ